MRILNYFGAQYLLKRQAGYDSVPKAFGMSVWLRKLSGVDPLAGKYPSMSPYMYTAGNPVMLVDPNGMWDDGYTVDKESNFEKVSNTGGDKFDVIYSKADYDAARKSKKILYYNKSGKHDGLIVDKSFLKSNKKQGYQFVEDYMDLLVRKEYNDRYSLKDDKKTKIIFEFLSDRTNVEWGIDYLVDSKGNKQNIIMTSHETHTITGSNLIFKHTDNTDFKIIRSDHCHHTTKERIKQGIDDSQPSGMEGDLGFGKIILNKFPNTKFNIYFKKKYHPYAIPK